MVGLVRDEGIRLVSLMHIGGDGWLKTLDFAPRDESHFRDVLMGGERCDVRHFQAWTRDQEFHGPRSPGFFRVELGGDRPLGAADLFDT